MCSFVWSVTQKLQATLAFAVLPFSIWCLLKHIKNNKKSDPDSSTILYKLSITIYLCTIIGSMSTTFVGFTSCTNFDSFTFFAWLLQWITWIIQYSVFLLLLFLRYIIDLHIQYQTHCINI